MMKIEFRDGCFEVGKLRVPKFSPFGTFSIEMVPVAIPNGSGGHMVRKGDLVVEVQSVATDDRMRFLLDRYPEVKNFTIGEKTYRLSFDKDDKLNITGTNTVFVSIEVVNRNRMTIS